MQPREKAGGGMQCPIYIEYPSCADLVDRGARAVAASDLRSLALNVVNFLN